MIHTHNGTLLGYRKNEVMPPAATRTDTELVTVSEVSQKRKTNNIQYSLYVESKKKLLQINLFTKQKQIHRHRRNKQANLWLPEGKGVGGKLGVLH